MTKPVSFAYISRGKLVHVAADGEKYEIESQFVADYRARAKSAQRKTAWKTEGTGAKFMGGGMLWGRDFDVEAIPVAVTGLARGHNESEIVYTLSTGVVGGVFRYDTKNRTEKRVFHSAEHRLEHVATSRDHQVLACTLRHKDGTTSLAVMPADGSQIQVVTEGDSIDLAPAWLPSAATKEDHRHALVFQSAGIGRNQAGQFVAIGPAHVAMLDPEHGVLESILEKPTFDYLLPRMAEDRTLYFIRRDYQDRESPSFFRSLLDALLFPFRLLAALFSYLNFFTLRYTGKPLMTSGSARKRSADMRNMLMMGNMNDAEQAANQAAEREDTSSLFAGWTLCAKPENGDERVIARGIRAFDLLPSGDVLATNGTVVERIDKNGKRHELHRDEDIVNIVAL